MYFVKIMFLTLGRVTVSFAAVVVVFHEKWNSPSVPPGVAYLVMGTAAVNIISALDF